MADELERRGLREAWAAEKVVLEKAFQESEAKAAKLTQQKASAEEDRNLAGEPYFCGDISLWPTFFDTDRLSRNHRKLCMVVQPVGMSTINQTA